MTTAKRVNWIEEWREARKNTTLDEIEAMADRLEAEPTERRGLTPEELDEKYGRVEEPQTAPRRAELVGA